MQCPNCLTIVDIKVSLECAKFMLIHYTCPNCAAEWKGELHCTKVGKEDDD